MVIFTLFYSLLDLRSSECDVVSLYVVCCSVNVSCVFVSVCELFGCGCCFVVECYGSVFVGRGALLDRPCMVFQRLCALCPNERLSAPSICFVCVFVCRKLSLHLAFGMLCLSAISMMFVKIILAVCMLVGMVV